jgi:hypothetical protein
VTTSSARRRERDVVRDEVSTWRSTTGWRPAAISIAARRERGAPAERAARSASARARRARERAARALQRGQRGASVVEQRSNRSFSRASARSCAESALSSNA